MELMVKKMKCGFSRRKKDEKRFLENGSIFLKELIADCNGKSIPIRRFSSSQILKATNNFGSSSLVAKARLSDYKWFKGIIEDKYYLIKRFRHDIEKEDGDPYTDIIVSARMSNHSNFLKLIGCCFEFTFPIGVFEYAEHGVLNHKGCIIVNGKESIMPWSVRLKIAKEIANAVTYLHLAFPKITVHRNIKPENIFLDKNWTAKLSEFSVSITLPEGKSRIEVESIAGTLGYLDPLHFFTKVVTEYNDVCSFGICLLNFLTGLSAYSFDPMKHITESVKGLYGNGKLDEVIDPLMAKDCKWKHAWFLL